MTSAEKRERGSVFCLTHVLRYCMVQVLFDSLVVDLGLYAGRPITAMQLATSRVLDNATVDVLRHTHLQTYRPQLYEMKFTISAISLRYQMYGVYS